MAEENPRPRGVKGPIVVVALFLFGGLFLFLLFYLTREFRHAPPEEFRRSPPAAPGEGR